MNYLRYLLACGLAIASPAAAVDVFQVSFEAPGVQNTSFSLVQSGVENFNGRAASATFTNNFSPTFSVTYNTIATLAADNNGGAGSTGRYMRVAGGTQETISISNTTSFGTNYFGMWISAFDAGNFVDFRRAGQTVFTFGPSQVLAALGACPGGPYCGNPNPGPFFGAVAAEPFAFVNFWNTSGFFDQVVIRQASPTNANAGYQTDNHTFGFFDPVPEPANWLMIIAGMGMVGAIARRRNIRVAC